MSGSTKINQIIATTATFILVSSPSLKIFYSSQLINIIALALLLVVYFRNIQRILNINLNRRFFSFYLIAILIFFTYLLFGKNSVQDFEGIFRYLYCLTALFLLASLNQYVIEGKLGWMIVGWGTLIAVLRVLGLLQYNSELGQTYLTAGLPMGAALAGALMLFSYSKENVLSFKRLLPLIAIIVILSALLISRGRSNVLYPIVVFVITLGCVFFFNKRERLKYGLIIIVTGVVAGLFLGDMTSDAEYKSLNRLSQSAENLEGEERYVKWGNTIQLISANPFGYGVDACYDLIGNYPHNIFLEIALSYGIIIVILFLVFVFRFVRSFAKVFSRHPLNSDTITLGSIGLYFFFTWNTSFDLPTSYIPLSIMILFLTKRKVYEN